MTISPESDNPGFNAPIVADVTGLSPGDHVMAALVYAQFTGPVLPVAFGKHPGSIVGSEWPQKSSRDPATIIEWWGHNPDAGIALHTGKSGLTFFDLDAHKLPDELAWLQTGVVQYTRVARLRSDRAHYGFHTGPEIFVSGPLKLEDGSQVGDVKSGNSVIILSPSPHVNAGVMGGEYRWRTDDLNRTVPPLPDIARAYLTPIGTTRAGWAGIKVASNVVTQALSEWMDDERPKPLERQTNWVREHRSGTRNWMRTAFRITASESRVGFYPLKRVEEEIRAATKDSYVARGEPQKFSESEVRRGFNDGVGYALSRSIDEILAEANGDYGTGRRPEINFLYPQFKPTFAPAFKPTFYRTVR